MDLSEIKEIYNLESTFESFLKSFIQEGWILIETKKNRSVEADGSFQEEVIFILGGKESAEPPADYLDAKEKILANRQNLDTLINYQPLGKASATRRARQETRSSD